MIISHMDIKNVITASRCVSVCMCVKVLIMQQALYQAPYLY